ncbi:hypothetical protein AB0I53_44725 [Saccharopolyspora sp. NPDC050389]|uniref:hypothetical protein n=1 Tax=Saccharopolyspora sp. NPDC050389 TaxID=3155516 RepID=UPI0033F7688F
MEGQAEMTIATLAGRVVAVLLGALAAGCTGNPGLDSENDRFKALPQICDLVSPQTATQMIGERYQTGTIAVETGGYCLWTYRDLGSEGARPLERKLSLHASLHRSNDEMSGAGGALEELDRLSENSPNGFERVLGFGSTRCGAPPAIMRVMSMMDGASNELFSPRSTLSAAAGWTARTSSSCART